MEKASNNLHHDHTSYLSYGKCTKRYQRGYDDSEYTFKLIKNKEYA